MQLPIRGGFKLKFNLPPTNLDLPINYDESPWPKIKQAREQYVAEQDGRCWHCNNLLESSPAKEVLNSKIDWSLFPPRFQKWPIHLHHCHETGMSIGAVHMYCNAYLWQYLGE